MEAWRAVPIVSVCELWLATCPWQQQTACLWAVTECALDSASQITSAFVSSLPESWLVCCCHCFVNVSIFLGEKFRLRGVPEGLSV